MENIVGRFLVRYMSVIIGVAVLLLAAAPQSRAQEGVQPATYRIGPGDVLKILVLGNPELSTEVPVRPDGKISGPLIVDMAAVGKTPSELESDIEVTLSEFVRSPTVSVIVTTATSSFNQIRVVGQAINPKAIPFRAGITVLDAVIAVNGLSEFAAGNRAKIVRTANGRSVDIKVRLDDLVNKGDTRQNVELQPGDILIIPQSRF